MTPAPLIVDGRAPAVLPAYPLPFSARDRHPLYILERTIYLKTAHGWLRIPRGYVTDFGSIPWLAIMLSALALQPLGPWAWAALGHDWGYAIGQPGYRPLFDDIFRERMRVDGVDGFRRDVMYRAVRLGGQGGYDKAPSWWGAENFGDPDTGAYLDRRTGQNPVSPPFTREAAFVGMPWGARPVADWPELQLAA